MKKQIIYFDKARRGALACLLADAAATITAAGDTFRELFPSLPWNTRALWVLAFEPEARDYYCKEILKREEEASGLRCDWDYKEPSGLEPYPIYGCPLNSRPAPLSAEARVNRHYVRLRTQDSRDKIQALGGIPRLEEFLRTGVLSIGKAGETIIAKDAEERLDDFCTLYAEGPQQAAFVEGVEKMRAAANALLASYLATAKSAKGIPRPAFFANCAGDFVPTRLELLAEKRACYGYQVVKLLDPEAVPRALITLFDLGHTEKRPKFYNLAGIWAYTKEEAEEAAGCKLLGLSQKRKLPSTPICPPLGQFR